jgi:hypothetical protein
VFERRAMSKAGTDLSKQLSSDVNVVDLAKQMGLKVVNMSPSVDEDTSAPFGDEAPKVLKLDLQVRMRAARTPAPGDVRAACAPGMASAPAGACGRGRAVCMCAC